MKESKKGMSARLCLIIAALLLVVLGCVGCDGCDGVGFYESSDPSTYRNFGLPAGALPSEKIPTFPENLEKVETVNNYYFVANFPTWGNTSWEIFVDVTYSVENFDLELERISEFWRTGYSQRSLYFDDSCMLFNVPTYIAHYDAREYHQRYEYISIDEENLRIIYVYLDRPSRQNQRRHYREIVVPLEYQPKNYFNNLDSKSSDGYYFSIHTSENLLVLPG